MPACIHERTKDYEVQFHKPAPGGFVGGEPTIKDVCTTCNNKFLSPLDTYACSLYDAYFAHTVQEKENVQFNYDYDLLTRWLLKVSYNYARANKALDVDFFAAFADYMLHGQPVPNNLALLVQLIIPDKYSAPADRQGSSQSASESPVEVPPTFTRISQGNTYGYRLPLSICRCVQLNSYCFYLISATQSVGDSEEPGERAITQAPWVEVLLEIQADLEGAQLVPADATSLLVSASDVRSLEQVADHVLQHYDGYKKVVDRLSETDKKE